MKLRPHYSPSFNLPEAIAAYIAIRDDKWATLKYQWRSGYNVSQQDVDLVRTTNNCAREMVTLTAGPTTPVFHPLRSLVERVLCKAIDVQLDRITAELRADRKGQSPPRANDAPQLVEILPNLYAQ